MSRSLTKSAVCCLAGLLLVSGSGCTLFGYIQGIPANRLPASLLARSKNDMQEISLSRLRQKPSDVYYLGPNDILGIYIETVLGNPEEAPPVHFPEDGERAPSIGYPVPVGEDGTLALPLVPPIDVEGLTLTQATEMVRKAYTIDQQILPEGRDRILMTLLKRRTHRVFVVREEAGAASRLAGGQEIIKRGSGFVLDLPEGENDLLHALNETGGLPGLDARNEVLIIRGLEGFDGREWDHLVAQIKSCREPCSCPPNVPDPPNVTRIPLRFYSDQVPNFTEQDIILQTGDIVLIESRDREVFYTGGVLNGGEFPLPRDRDLDVLGAIAIAGGPVGSSGAVFSRIGRGGGGGGYGGQGGSGPLPPTDVIIIRELCDGSQVPIRVDLKQAYNDSRQRILIQPEDVVIMRYKCSEETFNTIISLLQFNFLFNGFSGNGF
jgi:protein involved in polysaccharide export with SLBB domain